jgi:hypothetical protein
MKIAWQKVCSWPSSTDIAVQANVGFRVNCGSNRRGFETALMSPRGQPVFKSRRLLLLERSGHAMGDEIRFRVGEGSTPTTKQKKIL